MPRRHCPRDKKKPQGQNIAYLVDLWIKCDSDWGEVEITEQQIQEHTVRKGGKRKYKMEHEIREALPAIIADAFIKAKKAQPDQWRANPDCPTEAAAIQYWCVDEGAEWNNGNTSKSDTTLKATLGQKAAAAILPERIGLDSAASSGV